MSIGGGIARFSIERPLYTWLLIATCVVGGTWGIDTVGRLEDPTFPILTALVITPYPGASAEEVEQEVTDVVEASLQELSYIKEINSRSVPGRSEITIELLDQYSNDETPQIYDELRRRVSEAGGRLPPGAGTPIVEDDFGDVYGLLYAFTAPGYTAADMTDMARTITTSLKLIPDVAKVQVAGIPRDAVYVNIDHNRFGRLGLPVDALFSSIGVENQVTAAGSVAFDGRRLRIAPELAFDSVAAVADMRIGAPGTTTFVRLADIAEISREPMEIQQQIIRHGGERVFTVGISIVPGRNVVEVGRTVEARLESLMGELPLGVDMSPIYEQHEVVADAIDQFLKNLALSVATVVGALCLFMGWRAGAVVGSVLLLTVLGTIFAMAFYGIELQRISLGALMIAMGMLVDNGIVVAEGMVMGVKQGLNPAQAAERAVQRTQLPLLGATIIGIAAFGPISLSDDSSGHFLISLFQVVAISLLLSWVLAVTVVPLLGSRLLRPVAEREELYQAPAYRVYLTLVSFGLRRAWLTALGILVVTLGCAYLFQFVKPGFFPHTNTPLIYVDYRLPEGTDLDTTATDTRALEDELVQLDNVEVVSTFVGAGASRFITIINPEQPNSAYAQMVVRVAELERITETMQVIAEKFRALRPQAEVQVTRSEFTPSGSSKIEARFSGSDPDTLRALADQTLDIYLDYQLIDRKTNWRAPALELVPRFDEAGARLAGITRNDVAQSLAFSTLGVPIGLFRDADKLLPIIARLSIDERPDIQGMTDRLVWSPAQQRYVPLSQVVTSLDLVPANATIHRLDRIRTIGVLANPPVGHNATLTFDRIRSDVEAIELPPGYRLEWGGEFEANIQATESLGTAIPGAFALMFLMTVLLFGALRQPIVIWLTVPMTICGVVVGLLITDLSFTFPAFLGLLSLSGMLIKNCIVLVDEIDKRLDEATPSIEVMAEASLSRLRPVVLAAGTTIAGMAPLLADAFFLEMAVCIMAGLAFATLLTLLAVPVFYRIALGKRVA